ncbi:NADH-quinone oxidoreductase subunit L [Phycisphaerae bacterium RAS1]|nr:NADH-quinone oxidoreductase subunit L [Phycisphaerae bacterium RAS1]
MILSAEIAVPALIDTLPFWPLLGAVLVGLALAGGALRRQAHFFAVGTVGVAAILGVWLFLHLRPAGHSAPADGGHGAPAPASTRAARDPSQPGGYDLAQVLEAKRKYTVHTLYHWISLGSVFGQKDQWIDLNFFYDSLTGVMMLVVTVVSLMVLIYSIGYMRDHHGHPERGYERFFAFLALFVFSMSMLVMAGNFVLLYLGWEAVGLCSYLLIGFYYGKPEAAAAAKKAFIVNRIGDLGFALGIFAIFLWIGPVARSGENPLDYVTVFKYVGDLDNWQRGTIALLLLCGALGKSAQFPLYVWLPDAMEGPSPVSALIHAATMVTAGVYMIARCTPIFLVAEFDVVKGGLPLTALDIVMWIGVIGAVLAATMAMAQYDMKRILAYSTMSQLAFMFVALGVDASNAAIFHLYTHAFFKALLFLGAGSVMHAMGGVIDLRRFSGLRSVLPKTYWLMLIGCLALAGFPFLAGFWSKDEIVHAAYERDQNVGVILLITAFMTAYYTFRMFFLCFHGRKRLPEEAGEHPHESPPVMLWPLYVLAFGAVFAGYLGVGGFDGDLLHTFFFFKPHGFVHHYLETSTLMIPPPLEGNSTLMYVSAVVAIAGIALAYARYGKAPQVDPDAALLGPVWKLWNIKYYVDEIYDTAFVRPLRSLGRMFVATDDKAVDGALTVGAGLPQAFGIGMRFLQQGALQGYALTMALGVTALLLLWRYVQPDAPPPRPDGPIKMLIGG